MNKDQLIKDAFEVIKNSYAPYSNYHVAASLLCKDGHIFHGVNVENASFGATNCAERSAIFAAISEGYTKEDFQAMAIVSDGFRMGFPCGICRQVLMELLLPTTPIYLSNGKEELETTTEEALPHAFTIEDVLR